MEYQTLYFGCWVEEKELHMLESRSAKYFMLKTPMNVEFIVEEFKLFSFG